jgi:hypothetical protein
MFASAWIAGCSSNDKEEAIHELISKESGTYTGYLFWNLDSDLNSLNDELLNIVNSNQVMQSIHFSKMNIISMNDKNQKINYVKVFNINKSPTLLIFDTEKLVLQTTNLKDLYTLAEKIKGERSQ